MLIYSGDFYYIVRLLFCKFVAQFHAFVGTCEA